jgi:hypothetical protein
MRLLRIDWSKDNCFTGGCEQKLRGARACSPAKGRPCSGRGLPGTRQSQLGFGLFPEIVLLRQQPIEHQIKVRVEIGFQVERLAVAEHHQP